MLSEDPDFMVSFCSMNQIYYNTNIGSLESGLHVVQNV